MMRGTCMKKNIWFPIIGVVLGGLALVFGQTGAVENGFTLEKYHNADAKFLGDQIITSVDEGIQILNLDGEVVQSFPELSASWMYVDEKPYNGEKVVAYSNHANETHILRLTSDGEFISDRVALATDALAIDPILEETHEGWLLAHTLIEGTINNPDPKGDNGTYTVKLYRSTDLENWEYVTDIIRQKKNTEDGDLRYVEDTGCLYYFCEMEEHDRGPSKICVMISEDAGKSWSDPYALTDVAADNEMASCEWTGEGWRLYMSSDMASAGESYQGACAYYRDYSADFQTAGIYHMSSMPDNESVRLYEVKEIDGQLYFLFARNYLTDCDLLLRTIEKEEN